MRKVLTALLLASTLSACSMVTQSVQTPVLEPTIQHNKQANIQVGRRVVASAHGTVLFGFLSLSPENHFAEGVNYGVASTPLWDFAGGLKAAAAYKAIRSDNADILLAPVYEVQVNDYFLWKTYKVSVKAYTGHITGIR